MRRRTGTTGVFLGTWLAVVTLLVMGLANVRAPGAGATAIPVPSPAIVDTNYAIPLGSVFVSPSGSDANPGTQAAPFRTVGQAIAAVDPGGTVVLRGGTYRESVTFVSKQVTLQPYPHEKAWMDGRLVLTGWTVSGSTWVHGNYNPPLCRTCYNSKAILASAPAAGLPDMIFVDGAPLVQVTSAANVTTGKFYVDATAQQVTLGTSPIGHTVEAAWFPKALEFGTTAAAGSVVRGIGFIGYGSNWDTSANIAMVIDGTPNMTFENDTFAFSASAGLAILDPGAVVWGDTFVSNGYVGLMGYTADNLLIESSWFTDSNREHFVYGSSPVAGAAGAKITSSHHVAVDDSVFENNFSTGLWFDMSSQYITIVRNLFRHNHLHGANLEISDTFLFASNVSVDNDALGLQVSGTTNTRVWNNTLANNGTAQVGVYEDARSNPDATQRALGLTWDTANVSLQNNVLAADRKTTKPVIHTYDGNQPKKVGASQMISGMGSDLYARFSTTSVPNDVYWANLVPTTFSTDYSTLALFRAATGFEQSGTEIANYTTSPLFTNAVAGDYSLVSGSPASGTGVPLPDDIAAAIGVAAGVPVDRGALVWAPNPAPPPAISIGDASISEGNSGTRSLTFPVTLSQPATTKVSVQYVLNGVTATGGKSGGTGVDFGDRGGLPGTVTFVPSLATGLTPTLRTIVVPIYGDTTLESAETFTVTLSTNPSTSGGATLLRAQGLGTILNDDGTGAGLKVAIGDTSIVEGNTGARTLSFPITLSQASTAKVSLYYVLHGVTATGAKSAGPTVDFANRGGVATAITFTPSATTGLTPTFRNVLVPVYPDTLAESNETFTVTVSGSSLPAGTTIIRSVGTGTIINDD